MRNARWIVLLVAPASAGAALVTPQLGGGSPGTTSAMKHADVFFQAGSLVVQIDESVVTPRLRPLLEGDEFDPAAPYSMLNGKGYNAQYGWNAGGFINLPSGSAIWVETLASSPGLEVYQAPIDAHGFAPILGTAQSSTRWKWSGRMSHNYYAVTDFTTQRHWASYRVYLGDDTTGVPLITYGAAEVTFDFALPGDFDDSGNVDPLDYDLWSQSYGATGPDRSADGNGDGVVDAADYTLWRDHLSAVAVSVPEPATTLLVGVLLVGSAVRTLVGRKVRPLTLKTPSGF
ncbi:hypothetical protein [Botrimarina mediterranea]|uniref:PEP-CTERM protein-sorting domain-containing protein n=1 Tax=Botrimarina mediterranea TaxID=2528022 RepID=A0A518KDU5_9BACT|nr:hypothetical protein [Botrimarina mediterranea]QDV75968.1 hypothetical protein Spa11_41910 [Botrimarina mediterranea]QDV80563.1 hypothetical protein K2D_41920 [Planctomycetes bacterium K2D]